MFCVVKSSSVKLTVHNLEPNVQLFCWSDICESSAMFLLTERSKGSALVGAWVGEAAGVFQISKVHQRNKPTI